MRKTKDNVGLNLRGGGAKAVKAFLQKPGAASVTASVLSIVIGLVFGLIVLLCLDAGRALPAFTKILVTGAANPDKFAKVLYQAAPLIMTGLAVAFAFKTGLFNIGATGQYTVGAMFALLAALSWKFPWWACLILAILGGAAWGAIPGLFKALLNVNEVITSIMFNWIGLFLVNLVINNVPEMLGSYYGPSGAERTARLAVANPDAIIPKWGLDKLLGSNYMNIGIFFAIIAAIIIYVILQKTTFGYELKACGLNKHAARYAGIKSGRSIILSMTISGALAGLGGGIYFLSGVAEYVLTKSLLATGFNGIPVALLGASNPIAVIFSGIFISYIFVGGEAMQPEFTKEIVDIISAAIIYVSALSLLVKTGLEKLAARKKREREAALETNGVEAVAAAPENGAEFIAAAPENGVPLEPTDLAPGETGRGILPDAVLKNREEAGEEEYTASRRPSGEPNIDMSAEN
ncbi:MAG: ABC transporter permease, partial [Christensenellales bacterium]